MHSKKFKYQKYLDLYPNCPPDSYEEIEDNGFRWIFSNDNDSFIPVLIINPVRQLGIDEKQCEGYALSMFKHEIGAYERYKKLVKARTKLKEVLGNKIAEINISKLDGIGSEPETNNFTHFNFHEYDGTDLSLKIVNITEIFDRNGNFKW